MMDVDEWWPLRDGHWWLLGSGQLWPSVDDRWLPSGYFIITKVPGCRVAGAPIRALQVKIRTLN